MRPSAVNKERSTEANLNKESGRGFVRSFLSKLGPGLVTGASDDDPSGIATYSQVGAQFGYTLLWTMLLSYPLMAAIQEICGRIGRVTGNGLAANIRKNYPKPVLFFVLLLMSTANVFNLGADIGAMGASMALLVPKTATFFTVLFGVFSLLVVLFVPYTSYAKYLKWLTVSLLAYIGVAFLVRISWREVLHATLIPHMDLSRESLVALIAVLGTTISPYLFFWQASQEAEEVKTTSGEEALKRAPLQAGKQLQRIHADTMVGMAFSNAVAFFIILTAAATFMHTESRTFQPAHRQPPPWSRSPVDSPPCSLSAALWAPVYWLCRSLRHLRHMPSAKASDGKPASRVSLAKRRASTGPSPLQP